MDNYKTLDSEWNFALAYFKRLDEAMRAANFSKMRNDFKGWLEALLVLHDELYPQMKDVEKKELDRLKLKSLNLGKSSNVEFYTYKNALSTYERELRVIMKERGMDMPRKSDPSRALLG